MNLRKECADGLQCFGRRDVFMHYVPCVHHLHSLLLVTSESIVREQVGTISKAKLIVLASSIGACNHWSGVCGDPLPICRSALVELEQAAPLFANFGDEVLLLSLVVSSSLFLRKYRRMSGSLRKLCPSLRIVSDESFSSATAGGRGKCARRSIVEKPGDDVVCEDAWDSRRTAVGRLIGRSGVW